MTTSPAQIDAWRAARSEHQRLEFKEAKTQFDNRKLYKYCVALANEGGGYLLLGIEDSPPRKVVGTAAFNDPVEMTAKRFQTLGFRVEIEEVLHPDGRVLVFHIPSRPLGTLYDFEGAYQHSCLRYVMNEKMTNQSLRERFRLPEKKSESVSRAIHDTVEAGKIKLADPEQTSLRYRHYVPFLA